MDLSILIPARNEEFLGNTIRNILENIEGKTEVIAVLDGYEHRHLPKDPRVTIIRLPRSIGQRAATNLAAKLSSAKWVMKVDAHCAFDKGFDVKMMADMQDDWTCVPLMRNLHAFDWVCPDGHRRYQGPAGPCTTCKKETHKEIMWIGKKNPQSTVYRFDKDFHFQYHNELKDSAKYKYGVITGYKLSFNSNAVVSAGIINFLTNFASSHAFTCSRNSLWLRQNMTSPTVGFSTVNDSRGIGVDEILCVGDKSKVSGIATPSIFTKMVNHWDEFTPSPWNTTNKPSVEDTMCECFLPETMISSISSFIDSSNPIPAAGSTIDSDFVHQLNNIIGGKFIYSEKTSSFHNGSVTLTPIRVKHLNESMSIQGSCFMLTRKKYWELDICEESYGSWGNQGVEVACKTWLSGGRVIINKKTWYAHMFRTQPGFSFPWPVSGTTQVNVRKMSKDIWSNNKWPKAKHKFQWLIDKFSPIPGWEQVTKGIVYYTDNQLDEKIAKKCQDQLMKLEGSKLPIVSVSLKPIEFGVNYVLPLERSLLTMSKQILKGLEESTADVIFFCEHDVLYHPSHFDFTPTRKDIYYYNTNSWMLRLQDGHCLFYEHKSLSGICAYRETLLKHYRERVRRIEELLKEANGGQTVKATSGNDVPLKEAIHRLGFEPGTHNRPEKVDDLKSESWKSEHPNVDIKHDKNWTKNRWKVEQFRDKSVAKSWKEADEIPFWGKVII